MAQILLKALQETFPCELVNKANGKQNKDKQDIIHMPVFTKDEEKGFRM
jgi:hypothetical protein